MSKYCQFLSRLIIISVILPWFMCLVIIYRTRECESIHFSRGNTQHHRSLGHRQTGHSYSFIRWPIRQRCYPGRCWSRHCSKLWKHSKRFTIGRHQRCFRSKVSQILLPPPRKILQTCLSANQQWKSVLRIKFQPFFYIKKRCLPRCGTLTRCNV